MRGISGGERALMASSHFVPHLRIELEDQASGWQDMASFNGRDYRLGAKWRDSVDSPIMSGTVMLSRSVTGESIAATMTAALANHPGGGSYAAFIRGGQKVRLSTASMAPGASPSSGDWREVFLGKVVDPSWGDRANTMTLAISDLGAFLMDQIIIEERDYSNADAGMPVETVMQQILDDNPVDRLGPVTLYVPTSPGWMIRAYTQARVPILQALRDLALQIGWDVRYRYDSAGVFQLTFFEPDRARSSADASFGPTEYLELPGLSENTDDIRNFGRVYFIDHDTGERDFREASSDTSIALYGLRYIEVSEDAASNIDTGDEAQAMVDAMITDLATPPLSQTIQTTFFWPAQLGDLYSFAANGMHYDSAQSLAVQSIEHELTRDTRRTTIGCRGKPSGAYADWLRVGRGGVLPTAPLLPPNPLIGPAEVEGTARDGVGEGAMHIPIVFERNTSQVLIYATEAPDGDDPPPAPDLVENRLAHNVLRHEGDIASAPNWATEVTISTTSGFQRRITALPVGPTGLRGRPHTEIATCVDTGAGPTHPPTGLTVTMSTVDGKLQAALTWTNGDDTANTRVWRNGIVVKRVAPGVVGLDDKGLAADVVYSYRVQHIKNGQTSDYDLHDDVDSPAPTAAAVTWVGTYPHTGGSVGGSGVVLGQFTNPDSVAYTKVFMNDQATLGGTYAQVKIVDPGLTGFNLRASDMPGNPNHLTRWFYLVASRPGYTDSVASDIRPATFG